MADAPCTVHSRPSGAHWRAGASSATPASSRAVGPPPGRRWHTAPRGDGGESLPDHPPHLRVGRRGVDPPPPLVRDGGQRARPGPLARLPASVWRAHEPQLMGAVALCSASASRRGWPGRVGHGACVSAITGLRVSSTVTGGRRGAEGAAASAQTSSLAATHAALPVGSPHGLCCHGLRIWVAGRGGPSPGPSQPPPLRRSPCRRAGAASNGAALQVLADTPRRSAGPPACRAVCARSQAAGALRGPRGWRRQRMGWAVHPWRGRPQAPRRSPHR